MKLQIFILSLAISVNAFSNIATNWKKSHDAGLDYFIYVPQNSSAQNFSLMISLHGCTQHAEDLAELANWEKTADANNMIVVLPNVPNGGVVLGCWDYYGKDHNEKNRHNGPLINLTESLIANTDLKIDKSKVFISGLSSGAGEAAVLGCMRPDLFSGVGINSGPAAGTEQKEVYAPNSSVDDVKNFCQSVAGDHVAGFSKQLFSVIVSDQDFIVNTQHATLAVSAMEKIYQASETANLNLDTLDGANKKGQGKIYLDADKHARISYIINNGLGHAWASGKGPGRTDRYVNPNSIDYPAYLANFFLNK